MRRVIVVDDEPHLTRVLKQALTRSGYDVHLCLNGLEGLKAIRDRSPDILITDIQMPRMTGQEMCKVLQEEMPGRTFPIYVMSSAVDREHREWSSQMKNVFFLEKPLSMRTLLDRLAAASAS
jgi:DNA-binding response OmpR family regulator